MTVARVNGTTIFDLRDTGAPVTPDRGCTAVDSNEVRCAADSGVELETGDGNDSVRGVASKVELGPGDDSAQLDSGGMVMGGPGDDTIEGGTFLDGGPGADTLIGGAADNTLVAADVNDDGTDTPAPDVIDGGGGRNTVSYIGDPNPVTVDLESGAGQGSAGEGDRITNVANVMGGKGDDVLGGDGRPNVLFGSGGNDLLDGRGGDDLLSGGSGFDSFLGGPGNDSIDAANTALFSRENIFGAPNPDGLLEAAPEPVDCGAGLDHIATIDGDLLDQTCEVGDRVPPVVFPRVTRDGLHARFRLPCPDSFRYAAHGDFVSAHGHCRGRVTLEDLDGFAYLPQDTTSMRFRIAARGGVVRARLPVSLGPAPRPDDRYLRITLSYGLPTLRQPLTTRYVLFVPKGCRGPTRCGATSATP